MLQEIADYIQENAKLPTPKIFVHEGLYSGGNFNLAYQRNIIHISLPSKQEIIYLLDGNTLEIRCTHMDFVQREMTVSACKLDIHNQSVLEDIIAETNKIITTHDIKVLRVMKEKIRNLLNSQYSHNYKTGKRAIYFKLPGQDDLSLFYTRSSHTWTIYPPTKKITPNTPNLHPRYTLNKHYSVKKIAEFLSTDMVSITQ